MAISIFHEKKLKYINSLQYGLLTKTYEIVQSGIIISTSNHFFTNWKAVLLLLTQQKPIQTFA